MIRGYFDGNSPMIQLAVRSGSAIQAPLVLLDTGFTGDLQVTLNVAGELGLKVVSTELMRAADGRVIQVPFALAFVEMEGVKKYVQVLISESISLAGISLLSRFQYKAIVDCKYKTVALEKA